MMNYKFAMITIHNPLPSQQLTYATKVCIYIIIIFFSITLYLKHVTISTLNPYQSNAWICKSQFQKTTSCSNKYFSANVFLKT